jgi:hypothetical protein
MKKLIDRFVSFGAAIVVLGALFKLEHLPFASTFLWVGLIVEAAIFTIYGLFPKTANAEEIGYGSNVAAPASGDNKELSNKIESLNSTIKKVFNLS